MRFIAAFAAAVMITAALFMFMQKLIENRQNSELTLSVFEPIEIIKPRQISPQVEPPPPEQQKTEPVMDELQIPALLPQPAVDLEIPSLDLAPGDLNIQAGLGRWNTPLAANAVNILEGQGLASDAYVEVVPIGTRTPNVPELAWKNKINGWVLVAFNVLPNGLTDNIRVLDASPRGVFEEKVIAAVEDWIYSVHYFGDLKGEIILTQKVEVKWKAYPNNLSEMDR
jgi:protein TonB